MQAVARVRHRAQRAKTGHGGTLDPLASGVLVMAVGRATKLIDQFVNTTKRYRTEIDLSAFTTTDDREGEREEVAIDEMPARSAIDQAVASMIGERMQQPPAFSAVKIGGRRSYKLARSGTSVSPASRLVKLLAATVLAYDWPLVSVELHTGKGFYVRSFARDLGRCLGTGGHCASLRRTAVGPFDLTSSVPLDDVPDPLHQEHLISPERAIELLSAETIDRPS